MKRKTAMITGSSRGIGRETAVAFAGRGYDLILNCMHSETELLNLAARLERQFAVRILCCCGDIGNFEFVQNI